MFRKDGDRSYLAKDSLVLGVLPRALLGFNLSLVYICLMNIIYLSSTIRFHCSLWHRKKSHSLTKLRDFRELRKIPTANAHTPPP